MPDAAGAVGPILTALRALPVWVLGGLAVAGYAVLFLPAFGAITPVALDGFRANWGVWAWVEAVAFSTLAIGRAIDSGVTSYRLRRHTARDRKALVLVPRLHPWWYLAKQQDDSYASQISLRVDASNLTDQPVRILSVKLIRPRHRDEVVNADVMLPMEGSPYHSPRHQVPANGAAEASVHIMVRGSLGRQGKPIRVTICLTDQSGEEYRLKGIRIPSRNQPLPPVPWRERIAAATQKLKHFFGDKDLGPVPPAIWQHEGRFQDVDLILAEERRNYAANGRTRGGLGSLNVTLQSEPNHGWTREGAVPRLLWEREEGQPAVDSPNFSRLMRLYASFDDAAKGDFEDYLLSHLNKLSVYADVAYFVFLALHRMGRTVDGVAAAQANLAGDKVFGYSNLLGMLSAVVSREHFDTDPALYPPIAGLLANHPEHNFRLVEKMNLARLQHVDARQA
ncbi:hypothetical protein IQ288_39420 [Burkholderia sp. R-69980]|nr:hypothetical protein [Burkholderia sp. R-69980]